MNLKEILQEDTLVIVQGPDGWQYGVIVHKVDNFVIVRQRDGVRVKLTYDSNDLTVPTKGGKPVILKRNMFGEVRWPI